MDQHIFRCDAGVSYSSQRRRVRDTVATCMHQIMYDCSDINNVDKESCVSEISDWQSSSAIDLHIIDHDSEHGDIGQPERPQLGANCETDNNSVYSSNNSLDDIDIGETDSELDSVDFENSDDVSLQTKLAVWAVENNITHSALRDLLAILRCSNPGLPIDPRTLLKTPRNYNTKDIATNQGQYFHFGLIDGIKIIAASMCLPADMGLQFNFDGLPIFKSSACEFWPILCLIKHINAEPFVVGLYCGKKKPASLVEYLEDFVQDLQCVLQYGIEVNGQLYSVHIDCFVCDAPARAYIKNVKCHSGYFGCDKCTQEGDYVQNRMTFPRVDAPLRTDVQFAQSTDDEHHRGPTPLSALPIGLVTRFGLDYMHLVCLGVMRKLLNFWLSGPLAKGDTIASRLPAFAVKSLSARLLELSRFVPREFARKPRSLTEIDRWKATEFRTFLLYTGPVVLNNILPHNVFCHFMLLSTAISLLANPDFCHVHNDYANQLLITFVTQASHFYGPQFLVYNVHALVHLAADVKRFGCLDSFSAFPFENQLQTLKRLVRKAATPLSQIIRRISERGRFRNLPSVLPETRESCTVCTEHSKGPLPVGFEQARQFAQLRRQGLFFSLSDSNNCVVLDGVGPVLIRNILSLDGNIFVVCEGFKKVKDLYSYPLQSAGIGIVSVSVPLGTLATFPVAICSHKCVRMPDPNDAVSFCVLPLVHCSLSKKQ